MHFGLLGPFEARTSSGEPIVLRRRRERSVLAVLLLESGRLVGSDRLVELLWHADPPPQARATVHSHVSRIRAALRAAQVPEEEVRLYSQANGYVLEVPPDSVDLHQFRALVARARATADVELRAVSLRAALTLWRGPALVDAVSDELRERLGSGLEELRMEALAERIDADLALGRHGHLVAELTQLVGDFPLRERLRGQLMIALYRSGRRADALETYRQGRRVVAEELGLVPGPELRELEQSILTDNRSLLLGAPSQPIEIRIRAESRAEDRVALAQLPAYAATFTGRAEYLSQLDSILARTVDEPASVVISAIAGTAGVGKTALAVYWAHAVADRFPDGQLYVNLRGFDPGGSAMSPAEAVRGFLDAFGVSPQRIPVGLEAQTALYRSLLTGRRVLIVLDNARDAEQVRPLLPGARECLVLVTSRNQLPGLVAAEGAHPITLDLLSTAEARQLLERRLGTGRVAAEPPAVDEIIASCAGLPLALTVVAARAAMRPGFSLATLAGELRDARGGLDAFAVADAATDARTVFSWSYDALGADAARLFRLLGIHPGPDIAAPAAASLAGIPLRRVRPLLAELASANLIAEHTPGRYTFHDLLRAYATELAHDVDSAADRSAAVHRILDHYLHTAHAANEMLSPHGDPITLAPPHPEVTPESFGDHAHALAWFSAEHRVLLAVVEQAADTGFDTHIWHLAWTLADFFDRQGHSQDWAVTQHAALNAARRLNDLPGQARTHRNLARAYSRVGRYDDAHTHLRQALDLYGELGDDIGQARTHMSLGGVFERQGRNHEALSHSEQGLALFRAAGHRAGQARALNAVGWRHTQLGNHEQALGYCQQALTLLEELGDRDGQGDTWDSLGYVNHQLGDHRQATICYQRALDLARQAGDRHGEADTLTHLGDTHHAAGDRDAAAQAWQHALTIFEELGHPGADQLRTKLRDLTAEAPAIPRGTGDRADEA